ncbi:unnamed protein product [Choristocarpus tenellus]
MMRVIMVHFIVILVYFIGLVSPRKYGALAFVLGASRRGVLSKFMDSHVFAPSEEFAPSSASSLLTRPILELITPDGCASSQSTADTIIANVEEAIRGGVSLVQLRDYDSTSAAKISFAHRLRKVTLGLAYLVVNGDPDMARICGADGVHLPERMMGSIADLRCSSWPHLVGCSVHSIDAAVEAARQGAHYIQVGTMFATQCHPGKIPEGVSLVRDIRRQLNLEGLSGVSIIGVGGINGGNCEAVLSAGADGVAVIRSLCNSNNPEANARALIDVMSLSGGTRKQGKGTEKNGGCR